jgi:hypothetical protein
MGSKVGFFGSVAQLRAGLAVLLGKSQTLMFEGKEVKRQEILDLLDELVAMANASTKAKAAYHRILAEERAFTAQALPMVTALRTQLIGRYSREQLAECGLAPRKAPRSLSSAERIVATAKSRATRAAHGRKPAKVAREEAAQAKLIALYAPPRANGASNGASNGAANGAPPAPAPTASGAEEGPSPVAASVATH